MLFPLSQNIHVDVHLSLCSQRRLGHLTGHISKFGWVLDDAPSAASITRRLFAPTASIVHYSLDRGRSLDRSCISSASLANLLRCLSSHFLAFIDVMEFAKGR